MPARASAPFCTRRWATLAFILLVVLFTTALDAPAATITSLVPAKNASNTSDYATTGPRREFRSDLSTMYSQPDSFCVRYASVLAVDVGFSGNTESEGSTSSYRVTFNVAAGGGEPWTIKLWSHRKGQYTILDDDGGQASAAIVTPINATCSTGLSLATFQFAGGGADNHSNKSQPAYGEINDPSLNHKAWALLTGTGPAAGITINFTWSDNVISDPDGSIAGGDEAAVRLGLSTVAVNRVRAGNYEDLNDRVKENDGHFFCARVCPPPKAAVSGASYCSALDNSTCTFAASGTVLGCLGNCYTVVCKFYNKNGVLVRTATTSVINGSLSWVAASTAAGPCTGDPYTMDVSIIDDACSITSESLLAELADDVEHVTVPVAQSPACAGSGGSIQMPSTTLWGRISVGLSLLAAGAFLIRRRYARSSG